MNEQAGRVLGGEGIVGCPLVEHQQGEVSEQAGHEDDLRDEAQEDVQRLLEVPAASGSVNSTDRANGVIELQCRRLKMCCSIY